MIQAGALEPGGVYRVNANKHEYIVDSVTVLPSGLVTIEWTWLTQGRERIHRSWTGVATEHFADLHVNYVIDEDPVPA